MASMTSRERVLAALNHQEPDRVPWIESYVKPNFAKKLLGYEPFYPGTVRIPPDIVKKLALDNYTYNMQPPRCTDDQEMGEVEFVAKGLLKNWDDFERFKATMPDPAEDKFYEPAKDFLNKYKGDYFVFAGVRFGLEHTFLSMGMQDFCMMVYDDPKLVHATMELFSEFSCKEIERLNDMGFDGYFLSDDLAFKTGPLISPKQIREFFLPYMKKVTSHIGLPWVYHSCGNIMPVIEDLLSLGMNGIANIEPGPMDIYKLKENYGDRVTLVGNIDLHYTLTMGTPEETEQEVKEKIKRVAPGGGYIISSANGLTAYVKPENVVAMSDAILKYGKYPISID